MKLPIYELKIDETETSDEEVTFVALVDQPAIRKNFLAFREAQEFVEPAAGESQDEFMKRCIPYITSEGKPADQAVAICQSVWKDETQKYAESYTDYPKGATENAKIALRWAEENGWGDCGTPVGKKRANDLAAGRPLSRETIARMAGFERHRQSSQRELGDGCGRLMWLAWGGDEGIEWAQRKLDQIDREEMRAQPLKFSTMDDDQRIITGPLMLADELIYRNNDKLGEHYVKFSAETIRKIAIKFSKKKYQTNVNLMHDGNQQVQGVTMFESWLVDKTRGTKPMAEFQEVPEGSWFGSFYVENEAVWQQIKSGELRGFSVEGLFEYDTPVTPEENALKKIAELLNELSED